MARPAGSRSSRSAPPPSLPIEFRRRSGFPRRARRRHRPRHPARILHRLGLAAYTWGFSTIEVAVFAAAVAAGDRAPWLKCCGKSAGSRSTAWPDPRPPFGHGMRVEVVDAIKGAAFSPGRTPR
jgi:hypothetical protein